MSSRSSGKLLPQHLDYHRIAADVLNNRRPDSAVSALLEAAEAGAEDRVKLLLDKYRAIVNLKCETTGDTALIAASRNRHHKVVDILLKYGADCTLQNDNGETVLEVGSSDIVKQILKSIKHDGTALSNAQAFLHSAWLGDAVTVRKGLSGNVIDVNCHNSDGLTPMLLVTRDIGMFEKVQHVMQTEYNPAEVLQELIRKNADVTARDSHGMSPLHLVATNKSVQAKKMVSLLLKNGASTDSLDHNLYTPLHVASEAGHTAIIVALLEEGGADINMKGGERGDTALMLSAREGHKETAQYLISKGADVTVVDKYGDTALDVAKTSSMISLLKDALEDQNQEIASNKDKCNDGYIHSEEETPIGYPCELSDDENGSLIRIPQLPETPTRHDQSFFITDRNTSLTSRQGDNMARLESVDSTDLNNEFERLETDAPTPDLFRPLSEVEADDELEEVGSGSKRIKPATRRSLVRHTMEESIASRRSTFPREIKESSRLLPARGQKTSRTLDSRIPIDNIATTKDILNDINFPVGNISSQHTVPDRRKQNKILRKSRSLSRSLESLAETEKSISVTPTSITPTCNTPTKQQKRTGLPGIAKLTDNGQPPKGSPTSTVEHLPPLSNLQPVAMVALDAVKESFQIENFSSKRRQERRSLPTELVSKKTLPNSVHSRRSHGALTSNFSHNERTSTGSSMLHRQLSEEKTSSKIPLLPAVVAPQFVPSQPPQPSHPSQFYHQRSRQPGVRSSSSRFPQPPSSNNLVTTSVTSTLAVVNEDSDSSSDKTLTNSHREKMTTPTPEDFQSNSLEQKHPVLPHDPIPLSPVNIDPHSPTSNVVINHAFQEDGDPPLSPIWNQMQLFNSDAETSSCGEYIMSYIGSQATFPRHMMSPDPSTRKVPGTDSGQGSDEDKGEPSSSDESENEDDPDGKEILKWKRGKLLGKGAFGKVWEGLMDSAKLIAVKEVELDVGTAEKAQAQFEKIQLEVDILRSLCHRNIVQYWGAAMNNATVYIFMEYISGGSLQSVLKRFGALDERTIAHYTRQIAHGLSYLHHNGVIHRDIKGANIMVTSKGVVKLIDFGCAKRHCQELSGGFQSVRGTPYWMAPEVICGHGYGRKSDIWSLGCTVYEMATTKPPWGELPPEAAMFQIGIGQSVPGLPDHLSIELKTLFSACLSRDPAKRPTSQEVLQHSFLLKYKKHSLESKVKKKTSVTS